MNCREGCKTKNHSSYAECLRDANPTVSAVTNSPLQNMYEKTKTDLNSFNEARQHGITPGGTTKEKVDEAKAASKLLGRPYNASSDPPANMIVSKQAAKFVNKTTVEV